MTLDIITADSLSPIKHGFFGRAGGASSGVFKGLNCGFGSSDQHEIVAINRGRVAEALSISPEDLSHVHQIHSSNVVNATDANAKGAKADAMVTSMPGIGLSILTADCQPVLFADVQAGVIGAAHAGWQGALNGVLEATLEAMVDRGASKRAIKAVIGPCISQAAYEVGSEFFERFLDHDPENSRFFAQGKGDHMQFDLPAFGLHRLREAGVGHAEWTRHCTYSDAGRFYSYRRSVHEKQADYGRLIAAIRL